MALFGGLAILAAPSARAATAVEPKASVYDALAPVLSAAPLHKIRIARVRRTLTPVTYHPAAVFSAAAIIYGHIIWF
jgi:hypothetical protein